MRDIRLVAVLGRRLLGASAQRLVHGPKPFSGLLGGLAGEWHEEAAEGLGLCQSGPATTEVLEEERVPAVEDARE
jgi:hypothetical protein